MATDWLTLQNEYLSTPIGLCALAQKHGESPSAVRKRAAEEGWAAVKRKRRTLAVLAARTDAPPGKTADKPGEDAPEGDVDRLARLMAISDQLTDQLARAAEELDKQLLKHKRKTRELVYDGMDSKGKPVEETVEENYLLEVVSAPVDRAGLQQLSATLKNLRAIASAGAGGERSVELVAALMKRLDDEAEKEEP